MDIPQLTPPDNTSQPTKKLFIGNLPKEATKEEISTLFSQYGTILNIRLLTPYKKYDQRYAIIRFAAAEEALRALKESASARFNDKPVRVSLYKNKIRPEANICVKNLDQTVDTEALNDLLSRFGEIVSCKILSKSTGDSLNYAYVQFSRPESASQAISQLNGAEFHSQTLRVQKFKPHKKHLVDRTSNTLYVRGFDESYTKEQLEARFSEYGLIESSSVASNTHAGETKYFGFVRYEDPRSAYVAIETLDGKTEGDITWYVKIYQTKFHRRRKLAVEIKAKNYGWRDNNVVIQNLPSNYDENKLKELGSKFGEVVSVKISKSKKVASAEEGQAVLQETDSLVGFICYSKLLEAKAARENLKDAEIEGSKIKACMWKERSD